MLFHLLIYCYFREDIPLSIVYSSIINYSGCKGRKYSFLALRIAVMTTVKEGAGGGSLPSTSLLLGHLLVQFAVRERSTKDV